MMQESGGRGKDPMQASECGYNKKYPKKPNGIKDPEYSIDCGVHYLSDNLSAAKAKSPVDMDRIKLALQGYNYGSGYIPWAMKKYGGYSYSGAVVFQSSMRPSLILLMTTRLSTHQAGCRKRLHGFCIKALMKLRLQDARVQRQCRLQL